MPELPRISLVTPSFNQSAYLEDTLRSVLDQEYPDLEYLVLDGNSTDNSVEIIRRYADRLAYWSSESDDGQYAAINAGFARSTGEIMGWLNSDDQLAPWALATVGAIFATLPEVEWITSTFPLLMEPSGAVTTCLYTNGFSHTGFLHGDYLQTPGRTTRVFIQQESTFWRRRLWERCGGMLHTEYSLAADFELWARFFQHAPLVGVETPLGIFRKHPAQKSSQQLDRYLQEAIAALCQHGGRLSCGLTAAVRYAVDRSFTRRLLVRCGLLKGYPIIRFNHGTQTWEMKST